MIIDSNDVSFDKRINKSSASGKGMQNSMKNAIFKMLRNTEKEDQAKEQIHEEIE